MMAPMPIMVRCTGPSVRWSSCSSATTGSGCSESAVVMLRRVLELPARRLGVMHAVDGIDDEADHSPHAEPNPGVEREESHHEEAHEDAARPHDPDERGAERALHLGPPHAQDHHADADDDEGEQGTDGDELS